MNKQYTEDGLLWTSSYNPPYNITKFFYYSFSLSGKGRFGYNGKLSSIDKFHERLPSIIEECKTKYNKPFYIKLKKHVYSLAYQFLEDDRFKPIDIDYDEVHDEYALGVSIKGIDINAMKYYDDWESATQAGLRYSYKKVSYYSYEKKRYLTEIKPDTPTRIWYITIDKVLDHYCF